MAARYSRPFIHSYADAPHPCPCEHGHLDCAVWTDGPCMDELLTAHEAEDADCPLCGGGAMTPPRCATPRHAWADGARLCECGTFDRDATRRAAELAVLVGTETDGAPILEHHDCADEPCAGCGRFFFHADDCPTPLERCPCVPDDTIGPRRRALESEPDEDRHGQDDREAYR